MYEVELTHPRSLPRMYVNVSVDLGRTTVLRATLEEGSAEEILVTQRTRPHPRPGDRDQPVYSPATA